MQTVVLIMLIRWKSTELEDDVGEWWRVGWGFTAGAAQTQSTHITFNYNFKDTEWESYCKQSEHRGNSFQAKQKRFSFPQSCPAHKHISISTSCVFSSAWPTQTVRFISLHWKWRETQCSCSSLAVSSWTALPVLKVQDTLRNMDCWCFGGFHLEPFPVSSRNPHKVSRCLLQKHSSLQNMLLKSVEGGQRESMI